MTFALPRQFSRGKMIGYFFYSLVSGSVWVDFADVPLLSSSFADEAFGKLFLSLGPVKFMQRVKLHNMTETVEGLVNKAIAQRMQTGLSDADS